MVSEPGAELTVVASRVTVFVPALVTKADSLALGRPSDQLAGVSHLPLPSSQRLVCAWAAKAVRSVRSGSVPGGRPSPGAATSLRTEGLEQSNAPAPSEPAAPGDGQCHYDVEAYFFRCLRALGRLP